MERKVVKTIVVKNGELNLYSSKVICPECGSPTYCVRYHNGTFAYNCSHQWDYFYVIRDFNLKSCHWGEKVSAYVARKKLEQERKKYEQNRERHNERGRRHYWDNRCYFVQYNFEHRFHIRAWGMLKRNNYNETLLPLLEAYQEAKEGYNGRVQEHERFEGSLGISNSKGKKRLYIR